MKRIFIIGMIAAGSISIASCNHSQNQKQDKQTEEQAKTAWEKQLDMLKADTSAVIVLQSFQAISDIKSKEDIKNIKTEIMSNDSYFPYKYGDQELGLFTWAEVKKQFGNDFVETSKKGVESVLNSRLKVGQKVIEISWKFKDQLYKTKAIVADKEGIIYDGIISSLYSL